MGKINQNFVYFRVSNLSSIVALLVNRKPSNISPPQTQTNSIDDFFYIYEDPADKSEADIQDEITDDSEIEVYFPADVNINVDEALVGLEDLLDE